MSHGHGGRHNKGSYSGIGHTGGKEHEPRSNHDDYSERRGYSELARYSATHETSNPVLVETTSRPHSLILICSVSLQVVDATPWDMQTNPILQDMFKLFARGSKNNYVMRMSDTQDSVEFCMVPSCDWQADKAELTAKLKNIKQQHSMYLPDIDQLLRILTDNIITAYSPKVETIAPSDDSEPNLPVLREVSDTEDRYRADELHVGADFDRYPERIKSEPRGRIDLDSYLKTFNPIFLSTRGLSGSRSHSLDIIMSLVNEDSRIAILLRRFRDAGIEVKTEVTTAGIIFLEKSSVQVYERANVWWDNVIRPRRDSSLSSENKPVRGTPRVRY